MLIFVGDVVDSLQKFAKIEKINCHSFQMGLHIYLNA